MSINEIKSKLNRIATLERNLKNLIIDLEMMNKDWDINFILDFEFIMDYFLNYILSPYASEKYINFLVFDYLSNNKHLYKYVWISPYMYEYREFITFLISKMHQYLKADRGIADDGLTYIAKDISKIIAKCESKGGKCEEEIEDNMQKIMDYLKEHFLNLYLVASSLLSGGRDKVNWLKESLKAVMEKEEDLWKGFVDWEFNENINRKFLENIEKNKFINCIYKKFQELRPQKENSNLVDAIAIDYVVNLNNWFLKKEYKRTAMIISGAPSMNKVLSELNLPYKNAPDPACKYFNEVINSLKSKIWEDLYEESDYTYYLDTGYDINKLLRSPSFFRIFLFIDYGDTDLGNSENIFNMKYILERAKDTLNSFSSKIQGLEDVVGYELHDFNSLLKTEKKFLKEIESKIEDVGKILDRIERFTNELYSLNLVRFQRANGLTKIVSNYAITSVNKHRQLDILLKILDFIAGKDINDQIVKIFTDILDNQAKEVISSLLTAYSELNPQLSFWSPPEREYYELLRYQFRRLRGIPWSIKFTEKEISENIKKLDDALSKFSENDSIENLIKINEALFDLKKLLSKNREKKGDEYDLLSYLLMYVYGEYDDIVNSIDSGYHTDRLRMNKYNCECILEIELIYILSKLKLLEGARLGERRRGGFNFDLYLLGLISGLDSLYKQLQKAYKKFSEVSPKELDTRVENLLGVIKLKVCNLYLKSENLVKKENFLDIIRLSDEHFQKTISYFEKTGEFNLKSAIKGKIWQYIIAQNNYIYLQIIKSKFRICKNYQLDVELNWEDLKHRVEFLENLENYETKGQSKRNLFEQEHFYEVFETLSEFYLMSFIMNKNNLEFKKSFDYLEKSKEILCKNYDLLDKFQVRQTDLKILSRLKNDIETRLEIYSDLGNKLKKNHPDFVNEVIEKLFCV